jgi:hypothetical protein
MLQRALADVVVLLHLGFILFAVFGALLAFRWPRVVWAHAPSAAWAALLEFRGWVCPLTPLENALRQAGGAAGYPGSFVDHYLLPVLYPPGLGRGVQLALGLLVVAVNGLIYWRLWKRSRRTR